VNFNRRWHRDPFVTPQSIMVHMSRFPD
jgi:hypothetical protein